MTQSDKAVDTASENSTKNEHGGIERVGPGGEVGDGQAGVPLHKPHGQRDRELGERERVGAGGAVGDPRDDHR